MGFGLEIALPHPRMLKKLFLFLMYFASIPFLFIARLPLDALPYSAGQWIAACEVYVSHAQRLTCLVAGSQDSEDR